jgi:hypothetical protein
MSKMKKRKIVPGLVQRLDPEKLRKFGNAQTSASFDKETGDKAVTGKHYFLVLSVDRTTKTVVAVPMYSKKAVGSQVLDCAKMTGNAPGWGSSDCYYSPFQYWVIPVDDFVAASCCHDRTQYWERRYYAVAETAELDRIQSVVRGTGLPLRRVAS